MKDKEVLQKAIEVAIENGWRQGSNFKTDLLYQYNENPLERQAQNVCFSHDFAKAFWGDKPVNQFGADLSYLGTDDDPLKELHEAAGSPKHLGLVAWQYHLQQMVLCENPIDYLRKFIKE